MEPPPGAGPGHPPYEGEAAAVRDGEAAHRGFEPRLPDSESSVLPIERMGIECRRRESNAHRARGGIRNPHLDGVWGRYVYHLHDSRPSPAAVATGGTTEVAVSAHDLALVDLGLDGRPRVAARDHATYFVGFVIPDMIELKDNYVGLSTVHARMLHQVIHDVLPVLNSELGSSAIGAIYVSCLFAK
jgi:hypothetical protein